MNHHFTKHLIVDGYNIIHAWQHTANWLALNIEIARDELANLLHPIHDLDHTRITIVFDGKGKDIEIIRPVKKQLTFSFLFTPNSSSADGLILHLVEASKNPSTITVATQDFALKSMVSQSGAHTLSPESLYEWVLRTRQNQQQLLNKKHKENNSKWKNQSPWNKL